VGWRVLWQRDQAHFQDLIDTGPKARQYFGDEFPLYRILFYYPGKFSVSKGKEETYSVESVNSDLRHYIDFISR
jgi:IS1 family transposase